MTAPERIWVTGIGKDATSHWWHSGTVAGATEYIRADLAKPAAMTPEVAKLVEAARKARDGLQWAQDEWDDEHILMQSEGVKFDGDKLRYDLLPPELLEETARVLTYGAVKYSERNWEKGMAWHRPFGALMRHMWAWWGGQDKDSETGYSHLAHAACCIAFLISYERRAIGTDDRHKTGVCDGHRYYRHGDILRQGLFPIEDYDRELYP